MITLVYSKRVSVRNNLLHSVGQKVMFWYYLSVRKKVNPNFKTLHSDWQAIQNWNTKNLMHSLRL